MSERVTLLQVEEAMRDTRNLCAQMQPKGRERELGLLDSFITVVMNNLRSVGTPEREDGQ